MQRLTVILHQIDSDIRFSPSSSIVLPHVPAILPASRLVFADFSFQTKHYGVHKFKPVTHFNADIYEEWRMVPVLLQTLSKQRGLYFPPSLPTKYYEIHK